MKKILLKIGTGILITLIVAICLIFIGMAYLFLRPGGELFGIVYVSDKWSYVEPIGSQNSLPELTKIKEVEINTKGYDIEVIADDSVTFITTYVKHNVTGFALKKNSISKLEYTFNTDMTKLVLDMREASGWVSASGSYIKVHIPKELMENNINLKLSTRKKSNINIYGEECTKLLNLDVAINRGDLYFDGLEVENVYLKANKASIAAGAKVKGVTSHMSLDVGNSDVNLLNAGEGAKHLLSETIPEIDAINYKVENLVVKSSTKKSKIRLFNCGYIYTDTSCIASNGNIKIYYLEKANLIAKDTSVWIYEITGNSESIFKFTGKGNLEVLYNHSNLNATTNSGKILILDMSDNVMSFETKSGEISVYNARKPISLIVESGKAYVDFDENPMDNSYAVEPEIISLRTYSGDIKINGVNKINAVVDEGGKPTIEIHFVEVKGVSNIDAGNANLQVVVPENKPIKLEVVCVDAVLDVDVGTATKEMGVFNGKFEKTVYAETTNNALIINASGNVKLMSNDVYELKK